MLDCRLEKQRRDYRVVIELATERARVALFGPSGSGKSTVLACLAGLAVPDGGYIRWQGERWFPPALPLHRRALGYLSQHETLFPHLSVADNVLFALRDKRQGANGPWVSELRERLHLDPLWHSRPHQLSGGQARRVALARTLARQPGLVLLDEPFTGLDRPLVRELTNTLKTWQERLGFTLIAVDHDPLMLQDLCPTVIAMDEGRVIQQGSWTDLRHAPANDRLRALLDLPV